MLFCPALFMFLGMNSGGKNPLSLSYFDKNFAFREFFVDTYIKLAGDQADPFPNSVRKGKDGWFFLGDGYETAFSKSVGIIAPDTAGVRVSCEKIGRIKRDAEVAGARFYYGVAPNKHNVYPQYLPLRRLDGKREVDFQKEELWSGYGIETIDLAEYIWPLKDSVQLYYKTDSHWNSFGGFLATKKLVEVIREDFPEVKELNIEDYRFEEYVFDSGDLTAMIKQKSDETQCRLRPVTPAKSKLSPLPFRYDTKQKVVNTSLPIKVLIIRDSFFINMSPFFFSRFGEIYSVHKVEYDPEMLEELRPDIVVLESVERLIVDRP